MFESRCPDEIKHKFINFPKVRGIAQLVAFLVWDQAVACSSHAAPTTQGRLAQLVQSICLTSRGSAVRIRQRPRKKESQSRLLFSWALRIRFPFFISLTRKRPLWGLGGPPGPRSHSSPRSLQYVFYLREQKGPDPNCTFANYCLN